MYICHHDSKMEDRHSKCLPISEYLCISYYKFDQRMKENDDDDGHSRVDSIGFALALVGGLVSGVLTVFLCS
jgi:hypothetical protein